MTGEMTPEVGVGWGWGRRYQAFQWPKLNSLKIKNLPDLTHFSGKVPSKKSNKIFSGHPAGQSFWSPGWSPPKPEKVTGFDPLFFERGPFSNHIGSRGHECVNTGIDIFGVRGPWYPTISPALFQNPWQVRLKKDLKIPPQFIVIRWPVKVRLHATT